MKLFFRVFAFSVCEFLLTLAPAPLRAQIPANLGSITGTVLDQSGQAIEKASIAVKNENGGVAGKTATNSEGHFEVNALPLGSYSIEVGATGFATANRSGLTVGSQTSPDMSISLSVASRSESVNVEAVVSLATQSAPSGKCARRGLGENRDQWTIHQKFHTACRRLRGSGQHGARHV